MRRLLYLLLTGAAFCLGIAFIIGFFSDVLPLASTEPPSGWRLEMTVAGRWMMLGVAAMAAVSIAVLFYRKADRSHSQ